MPSGSPGAPLNAPSSASLGYESKVRLQVRRANGLPVVIALFLVAATLCVLLLQRSHRSEEMWLASVAVFAGAPVVSGVLWPGAFRRLKLATAIFLLAAPIAFWAITELNILPTAFKPIRDGICLATASLLVLVGSSGTVIYFKSARWAHAIVCAAGALAGVGAVIIITGLLVNFA